MLTTVAIDCTIGVVLLFANGITVAAAASEGYFCADSSTSIAAELASGTAAEIFAELRLFSPPFGCYLPSID